MKTLEQIIKDAETKVQCLSNEVADEVAKVGSDHPKVDAILQKVIDGFLKEKPKARKSRPRPKDTKDTKSAPKKKREELPRLSYDLIMDAYHKTEMKPFKAEYWFYEDRKYRPLVQVSTLNDERTHATPLTAYTLMKRRELLSGEKPPRFITDYWDLDKPSNTWTAGRISQISGLDMSYVLGFRSGSDGNSPGHPNCSARYHIGYQDGLSIRNQMIDEKLLEPDPEEDIYADEDDDGVLDELHRVRGYWRKEWDNDVNN